MPASRQAFWRDMPTRPESIASSKPEYFFAAVLSGENPPSFSTMETLYQLASQLYEMRPWHIVSETELVLVQDPITKETCYCSMMGVLGEVVAMYAYIGAASYRLFKKMARQEVSGAPEFFGGQHSVYVEFVGKTELEAEDRKLLAALGHPRTAKISPIFRAIRPGFSPWFVTDEEAQTLAEAMQAMIAVCSIVSKEPDVSYWEEADRFPLVSRVEGTGIKTKFHIEPAKQVLPPEPTLDRVRLEDDEVRQLRDSDYSVRGVLELDYFVSPAVIGRRNERKAFGHVALAVDADSGLVLSSEIASPTKFAGDVLAGAIIKAVRSGRALPREIRVRDRKFKDTLAPLSELCGFPIKVVRSLPALEEARAHLQQFLAGDEIKAS